MSMVASSIGTVPTSGFEWYLFFVESPFGNEIRDQVDKHFQTLGKEAGPGVLVVRGFDAQAFRTSLFEAPALHEFQEIDPPSVVVTDAHPKRVREVKGLNGAKVMVFPLRPVYAKDKDISLFFDKLLSALRSPDAIIALDKLDGSQIQRHWSWLTDYVELKPGFFGFNADLAKLVGDLLNRAS